ncbi:proline-rich protein 2-like [Vulpes lagopus]|uniref:proline-rich protein 2-like n=1 Tax=Vulpes lagopus TaxID=494514 RepID=UPI001BC8F2FC|nr:proline-rich protein 2-like [Vulpes lagopus]
MPPPSAQDRAAPPPRPPAARRLAPSRGGPPARGGAAALAEGRRRRTLRGLTKPPAGAPLLIAPRVSSWRRTSSNQPRSVPSGRPPRKGAERGGGGQPAAGRRGGGARATRRQRLPAPLGPAPPRGPPGPAAALRTRTTPQGSPAASRPSRPRGGPRTRTRTTPQVPGPGRHPPAARAEDLSLGRERPPHDRGARGGPMPASAPAPGSTDPRLAVNASCPEVHVDPARWTPAPPAPPPPGADPRRGRCARAEGHLAGGGRLARSAVLPTPVCPGRGQAATRGLAPR